MSHFDISVSQSTGVDYFNVFFPNQHRLQLFSNNQNEFYIARHNGTNWSQIRIQDFAYCVQRGSGSSLNLSGNASQCSQSAGVKTLYIWSDWAPSYAPNSDQGFWSFILYRPDADSDGYNIFLAFNQSTGLVWSYSRPLERWTQLG